METPKRKKGGKKRPQIESPSLRSYLHRQQQTCKPVRLYRIHRRRQHEFRRGCCRLPPTPEPEKSIGELLFDLAVDVYKEVWKKTDPDSYGVNQAIFEVAPYCPPQYRPALGLGVLFTAGYGFKRIVETAERGQKKRPH